MFTDGWFLLRALDIFYDLAETLHNTKTQKREKRKNQITCVAPLPSNSQWKSIVQYFECSSHPSQQQQLNGNSWIIKSLTRLSVHRRNFPHAFCTHRHYLPQRPSSDRKTWQPTWSFRYYSNIHGGRRKRDKQTLKGENRTGRERDRGGDVDCWALGELSGDDKRWVALTLRPLNPRERERFRGEWERNCRVSSEERMCARWFEGRGEA